MRFALEALEEGGQGNNQGPSILRLLLDCETQGLSVLVHCHSGINR